MLKQGEWKGRRAFIVGGGPSLRDFDWKQLEGEQCVVINAAYKHVKHLEAVFFTEDLRFIEEFTHRDDWNEFRGRKVVHCLDNTFLKRIHQSDNTIDVIRRVPKERRRCWGRSLQDGLSYASNSGIGAINLAQILGGSPLYLLGFDCRRFDGQSNFHDDYKRSWRTGDDQYKNFLADIVHWVKPHIKGTPVFNIVNPEMPSAIPPSCFPQVKADDVFGDKPFDVFTKNKNHLLL